MSIVYEVKLVLLILNETVWPTFTLMSVANPWIPGLPASPLGVSQTDGAVPGSWFSQGMGLTRQSTAWAATDCSARPARRAGTRASRAKRASPRCPCRRSDARGFIRSVLSFSQQGKVDARRSVDALDEPDRDGPPADLTMGLSGSV